MPNGDRLAIGIDIGGTNLKIGLISEHGHIVEFQSMEMRRSDDHCVDVSFISDAVKNFVMKFNVYQKLKGIGVASPGILDTKKGIVKCAVNLGWSNLPLVSHLENSLQSEVHLVSDSAAGATGERYYSAAGLSEFMYICIGTGVGASLVTNNELYRSANGEAINLGHTSIIHNGNACKCGNQGCLENYISAAALTERIRNESSTTDTLLSSYAPANELDTLHLYHAASKGDAYSLNLFREAGKLLGISIVNCIHLFGVSNIVIGGGVSKAGNYLLDPARSEVSRRMGLRANEIRVIQAGMPTKSGVIGAALRVHQTIRVIS